MQNMLITARLMIAAASERKESRGVHSRSDFPVADAAWSHHISMQRPSDQDLPLSVASTGKSRTEP
jgi:L-aspartate oxidase